MTRTAAATRSPREQPEPDRLEPFSTPRHVDRVFGHDAAAAEFEAALGSGHLHHAWALVGSDGIGKATLAYRLARTVLAGSVEESATAAKDVPPDHPVFRKVASLSHPNLLLIRRSWMEKTKRYSQWIAVDEVRRLRAFLGGTPAEQTWRVVIVDRADQLNQNAANALLKALEEPPTRTLFLLISSAEGRMPVTIRSRTRILRLSSLDEAPLRDAVKAALARDGIDADEGVLRRALALSEGSVRRALELVTGEGIELYDEIVKSFDTLPEIDGARLQARAEGLSRVTETDRLDLYLSLLLGLIERLVRFAATGQSAVESEEALAKRHISGESLAAWAQAWEAISHARDEAFALNLDRKLLVLDVWFRLRRLTLEHSSHDDR